VSSECEGLGCSRQNGSPVISSGF